MTPTHQDGNLSDDEAKSESTGMFRNPVVKVEGQTGNSDRRFTCLFSRSRPLLSLFLQYPDLNKKTRWSSVRILIQLIERCADPPFLTSFPSLGTLDILTTSSVCKVLDFDFEKLCSVSLSTLNVYACLVCGKYFQGAVLILNCAIRACQQICCFAGRGPSTHAYMHALEADHHVFINLHTTKIYCLPDGYEVKDTSLNDIQYNLHPLFTKSQAQQVTAPCVVPCCSSSASFSPLF